MEFWPEFFCSFLGALWKLFGLPGDLESNIINKEGYRKLKKLPGNPQEAQGRNFRNIFVGILDKTDFSSGHSEINWPLVLVFFNTKYISNSLFFLNRCNPTYQNWIYDRARVPSWKNKELCNRWIRFMVNGKKIKLITSKHHFKFRDLVDFFQ